MPVRAGCDFSFARPSVDTLKEHGMEFVVRYVSTPGARKNLTRGEVAAYHAAGIDIAVVFETGGSRAIAGRDAGATDARSALGQILDLGGPADTVIYFAVDWDVLPSEMSRVLDYLAGAASVLSPDRTGVYGSFRCVEAALNAGVVGYAWQTYAWSHGRWDERAHLQQYRNGVDLRGGGQVDMCRAMTDDFGQWGRTAHAEVDVSEADVEAALKKRYTTGEETPLEALQNCNNRHTDVVNKLDFLIAAVGQRLDALDAAVAEIKAGL